MFTKADQEYRVREQTMKPFISLHLSFLDRASC